MLVRDEADIIEATVRHLLEQVDEVLVADNRSTDGTREILEGLPVVLRDDDEVGYWQSRKTTRYAHEMRARGHRWVVPCDADEIWYAPDSRSISRFLAGQAPDIAIVKADLYNHVPTGRDEAVADPTVRIGWRIREAGALPKVAVKVSRGDFVIHAGNHGADVGGRPMRGGGLVIRHFPWRSEEQYLRKIRNGLEAYEATDLDPRLGEHWRMFAGQPDEAILDHYRRWFHFEEPEREDDLLIFDPAPVTGRVPA